MKSKEENFEYLKERIAISNLLEEEKMKKERKLVDIIKPMVAASIMIVSLSGIVFAKDISKHIYNKFLTGKGVEKAINEGYIEKPEMEEQSSNATIQNEETGEIIEDNETSIKVGELVMDDFTLSMTFEVTLSDKIKNIITAQEVFEMNFPDIVVYDENDIILNNVYEQTLNKFSEKNNIKPKEIVNSGVNMFVSEKNDKTVKVVYNFDTGGENSYPKSKKLHFDINKIKISKNETLLGDEEITIKGNWNFEIDVPEKMYDRQNIIYKQKSTTNKDFNVMQATLYTTGTEIKIKFKAEKKISLEEIDSESLKELQFYWSLDDEDELKTLDILNYVESKARETPEYQELSRKEIERWQYEKYLTNSKGEKFEFSEGPRANGESTIDDDGIMTSTCMFDLTQYDATDEITLHLDYKGNKADIVLEKVNR